MQQPSIGFIQSLGTGFNRNVFKPGALVSFTAVERLSDTSWIIQICGQKIKVYSSTALKIGELIRAKVILQEGKLFLKMQDLRSPIQQLMNRLALPDGKVTELIIRSFIEQEMPLKEETLRRAVKLMEQLATKDHRAARLISILYDKGLFITRQQYEKFQQLLLEKQIPHPDTTERRKRDNESGRKDTKEKDRQRKRDEQEKLRKDLRTQICRSGDGAKLLQMFNHLKAPHDNWIVIPLSFDYPNRWNAPTRGVLRIHTLGDGTPDMCTFTVFGEREWHFRINLQAGKERISLAIDPSPKGIPEREIVYKMRKKLSNLSFEIDDTISEMVKFSRFGSENRPDIKNIDTVV